MIITYTNSYRELTFDNFTLYGDTRDSTNIFYEYYNFIVGLSSARFAKGQSSQKEELTEKIKEYRPTAKSKLRISYGEEGVEFFKPNKYIFPQFYILFK